MTRTDMVECSPSDTTDIEFAVYVPERPIRDQQRAFVHATSHHLWLAGGQVKDRALAVAL
jgi:hypothetical protein